MSETIKFGYIGRGDLPYIFRYQNVSLECIDNMNYCYAKLSCTMKKSTVTNISKLANVSNVSNKDDTIVITYSSSEYLIDFTCKVDKNNYTRTFMANDIVLFECTIDPTELVITYDGMGAEASVWDFVDH